MKIFISHSSKDKWIARRISADLVELGAETFLDEKDIRTGESIDESIQEHLKDSHELLILLSPEALASSWVLIEIGGARALGLRLIPILLHVGINEVPAPVAKGLARDLNDIESYYAELKERMEAAREGRPERPREDPDRADSDRAAAPPPSYINFEVGTAVTVLPRGAHRAERADVGWVDGMEAFEGRTGIILQRKPDTGSFKLDIDGGEWWWAPDWLAPADDAA